MVTGHRVWASFAGWAVVGFLAAAGLLSVASVGVYILPVALVALVIVARAFSFGRGSFGVVAGVGAALLIVAVRSNMDGGAACTASTLGPGQLTSLTCGRGLSATPWAIAGAVALLISAAGMLVMSGRRR